jgi:hypothetical protein
MGLPAQWHRVQQWFRRGSRIFTPSPAVPPARNKKCPEIPVLPSYTFPPPSEFWQSFPSGRLPSEPISPVNIPALQHLLEIHQQKLTASDISKSKLLVQELISGVNTLHSVQLPGITVPNSGSVFYHGEEFTDMLAH